MGELYRIVVKTPTAHISQIYYVTDSSVMDPGWTLEKTDEWSQEISGKRPHMRTSLLTLVLEVLVYIN